MSLEAVEEILGALLDISRLDAGATKPEISDVPVADLMRMLEVEFAPLARQGARAAIRADEARDPDRPPPDAPPPAEPRLQRDQVHRARQGAGRLPAAGDGVRIEVWDTGLGIPADRQRTVFEEFRRLDQGARIARGLGLGLSIVERLGARARASAGPEFVARRGSVFSVTAPLGAAAPRAAETGAPQPAPADEPLSGLKVLAIDNEPRVLDGMRACSAAGAASSRPPRASPRRARRSRASARPTSSSPTITSTRATGSRRSGAARGPGPRIPGDPGDRRPQPGSARRGGPATTSSSCTSR